MTRREETKAAEVAFRAGVRGLPYNDVPGPVPEIHVATAAPLGPIERFYESMERLPGATDPRSAYQTGRAVRFIAWLLDQNEYSLETGKAVLGAIAGQSLSCAADRRPRPFSPNDAVSVFLDLGLAHAPWMSRLLIRAEILRYARRRPQARMKSRYAHSAGIGQEIGSN